MKLKNKERGDIKDMAALALFCAIIVIAVTAIALPLAWFDGHAKSNWLSQTRGVEIPWYEATFLDVNVQDNNVSLHK